MLSMTSHPSVTCIVCNVSFKSSATYLDPVVHPCMPEGFESDLPPFGGITFDESVDAFEEGAKLFTSAGSALADFVSPGTEEAMIAELAPIQDKVNRMLLETFSAQSVDDFWKQRPESDTVIDVDDQASWYRDLMADWVNDMAVMIDEAQRAAEDASEDPVFGPDERDEDDCGTASGIGKIALRVALAVGAYFIVKAIVS